MKRQRWEKENRKMKKKEMWKRGKGKEGKMETNMSERFTLSRIVV